MSESKEWVTVKVPEPTRDKARDDPRTYEEIMEAGLDADSPDSPEHTATLEVDGDDIRETIGEEIEKRLDKVTVNVDLGDMDLEGSELDENDVKTIVNREIEKTVHERARQL